MKTKTLTISNQKGGVGKTTTAVNLAHALTQKGKEVLIVDLDPQGQITTALGMDREPGVFNWLVAGRSLPEVVRFSGRPDLYVLPGDKATATAQIVLEAQRASISTIKDSLALLMGRGPDYILIDTGPSVGGLQEMGLYAAQAVLIPTACDYLSTEGVARVLETLAWLTKDHGWDGALMGILPTFYDVTTRETSDVMADLYRVYPDHLLDPIRRATILRECSAQGKTIWELDRRGRTADEFAELTKQVMGRL